MADYLARFEPKQQAVLKNLIAEFKLSFSNTGKFLMYVFEILKRDETLSFNELLTQLAPTEILANQNVQGRHKGLLLIDRLFVLRFPETARLIREGKLDKNAI